MCPPAKKRSHHLHNSIWKLLMNGELSLLKLDQLDVWNRLERLIAFLIGIFAPDFFGSSLVWGTLAMNYPNPPKADIWDGGGQVY
jgi:hypothetical protein